MLNLSINELMLAASLCRHFRESMRRVDDPYAINRVLELEQRLVAEVRRRERERLEAEHFTHPPINRQ